MRDSSRSRDNSKTRIDSKDTAPATIECLDKNLKNNKMKLIYTRLFSRNFQVEINQSEGIISNVSRPKFVESFREKPLLPDVPVDES